MCVLSLFAVVLIAGSPRRNSSASMRELASIVRLFDYINRNACEGEGGIITFIVHSSLAIGFRAPSAVGFCSIAKERNRAATFSFSWIRFATATDKPILAIDEYVHYYHRNQSNRLKLPVASQSVSQPASQFNGNQSNGIGSRIHGTVPSIYFIPSHSINRDPFIHPWISRSICYC